jgi:hypothetical protein
MQRYELWKIIERWALRIAGVAFLGTSLWLFLTHRSEPARIAGGILLLPCGFWAFWQLLHEDKLGTNARVSGAERAMYRGWIWTRRVVLGAVALVVASGAIVILAMGGPLSAVVSMAAFSALSGWVAVYGGGRIQSFDDDRQTHRERARRYD